MDFGHAAASQPHATAQVFFSLNRLGNVWDGSNPIIPPLPAGLLGKAQECEEKFVFVGGLLSCLSKYILLGYLLMCMNTPFAELLEMPDTVCRAECYLRTFFIEIREGKQGQLHCRILVFD